MLRTSSGYYEGAGQGRILKDWRSPASDGNDPLIADLDKLRNRSRAGVRSNIWAKRALSVAVINEVGSGISPRPSTPDDQFNQDLIETWRDWSKVGGFGGTHIYALQREAVRTRKESGDAFIIIHRLRSDRNSKLPVPLQFQLLEADYCPLWLSRPKTGSQNKIKMGIEFDSSGRRIAYWFHKKHPSGKFQNSINTSFNDLKRVKASDVIHHYVPDRPNALRGTPDGTVGLVTSYIYDKYTHAELTRKDTRSNFTGVIEKEYASSDDWTHDPVTGQPLAKDSPDGEVPQVEIQSGLFPVLDAGERAKIFDGDDNGRGYSDYQRQSLLAIAASHDIPYEYLTGDYSNINDRTLKGIENQYHRSVESDSAIYTIPQMADRIWQEYVERSVVSGTIVQPSTVNRFSRFRVNHHMTAWKHLHQLQQVQTNVAKINNNLDARSRIVEAELDISVEELDAFILLDKQREESLGINIEQQESPQ